MAATVRAYHEKAPASHQGFFDLLGCLLLFGRKKFIKAILIEAYDEFFVDRDNWYAHLTTLIDHFLALLEIVSNIMLRIRDIALGKVLLGHLAKVARRRAVDGDSLHTR